MALGAPLDGLDSLFLLAAAAVQDDGWIEIQSPVEGLSVWRQEDAPSAVLLRTRYEIGLPPEDAVNLFRPEVFFHESRKVYDSEVLDCGIDELVSPGDAFGFTRLRDEVVTPQVLKGISLVGTLSSCKRALQESGDDYYFVRQIRLAVRRDFPHPGMFAVARAPRNPMNRQLYWEWGISKASVGVFASNGDVSKSVVTEVLRFDRGASLSAAALAGAPRVLTFFRLLEEKNGIYRNSDAFTEATCGSRSYVVVTLRRCEKGPPLLPCSDIGPNDIDGPKLEWVQAEAYELPMYLRSFLGRIGMSDVEVYDQLDGRELMHYQAVLEKRSWERAWAALMQHHRWGKMQAAYRHMLGGVTAPQLRAGLAPRFIPLKQFADTAEAWKLKPPPGLGLVEGVVNRTFMHFRESDYDFPGARPRVGSESEAGGCESLALEPRFPVAVN